MPTVSATFRPGVWERLTEDPRAEPERAGSLRRYGVAEACESVRDDLTRLLNSNACVTGWPENYEELDRSLLSFGLPDWTAANMLSEKSRDELRRSVEGAIRVFEPRLTSVRVTLVAEAAASDRSIRLRIDGRLRAGDVYEPVSFESRLSPRERRFAVQLADR